jgi:exonuclease SbcC
MKINKIQIYRFGKLENYSLDFENGCNIIYGDNEDGKSTIMAFIKMMFYGSTGKSADLSKNTRKKYTPWDGSKMSGSIEFEDKGIAYRIERQFGVSNATDKIILWNKATGEKEGIASGTDLGQRFFGIGATAFEKSVFIGQAGSVADAGADKEDEITQKLLNLVSTGDESISQKKVDNRLQTAKEELKSRSGRIGVLDKKYQDLKRLVETRLVALEEEDKKKQMEQERIALVEQKEVLGKEHQLYQSQYDLQEKLECLQVLEKLILKKQGIDKLIFECEDRKQQLTSGDTNFDTTFIKNCEAQILKIQSLEEVYSERSRNARTLEDEGIYLKSQAVSEISQEYVEQVKAQEKELLSVRASITELKESINKFTEMTKRQASLTESEKRFSLQTEEKQSQESKLKTAQTELEVARQLFSKRKEDFENRKQELNLTRQQQENVNAEYQVAVHNMKSVEQLSNQKIKAAEELLKQVSTVKQVVVNENAGRSFNKPMFMAAIIILILSIVLGVAVHPVCFVGALLAAALGVISLEKTKIKSVTTTIVDEEEAVRAKSNLEIVQRAVAKDNEAAFEAEERANDKLQELKTKSELLQNSAIECENLYQIASDQVSCAEKKINELEINLKFLNEKLLGLIQDIKAKQAEMGGSDNHAKHVDVHILQEQLGIKIEYEATLTNHINTQLSKMGCSTIDELQNKNMQMQNHQTKVVAKTENLTKAKADEKQAKESLDGCIKIFIEFVSQYKPIGSYKDAVNTLHSLKDFIEEINTLQVKINSQSEITSEEMQGKTAEQIEKEATEIREQIFRFNDGIIPEKLEDWKAKQLKQQIQDCFARLQDVREALIKLNSNIKSQFVNKKNASQIDEEMGQLKKDIAERERDYQCLDIAQSTLMEAFTEIRQSFGHLLNDKTATIFNSLTGGKYQNVIISRNFDINVQDTQSAVSHEWQYLSSGTIDQAYFALRLAVADLLSRESAGLPLMLDDVFLRYDDIRAEQGLRFLVNLANESAVSTQIILFTCHKSILDWAQKNHLDVSIKSIF